MPIPGMDVAIHDAAVLIEFGGSLVVVANCLRAMLILALDHAGHGIVRARLLVADGVIAALGFKTAATLLKILELQNWTAILSFAAIFALRTLVKRVLSWEVHHLRDAEPNHATRDRKRPA